MNYVPINYCSLKKVIIDAYRRFHETGNVQVNMHETGRSKSVRVPRIEDGVLRSIQRDPQIGIRQVARQHNLGYGSVQRIIREAGFHAYHFRKVQQLRPLDPAARLEFCHRAIQSYDVDNDFFKKVLFTDECKFKLIGVANQRNLHHYARENPNLVRDHHNQVRI